MKTSKALAPISYNTEGFLQDTLNALLKSGDIDFWCYVKHKGELKDDYQFPSDKEDRTHLIDVTTGELIECNPGDSQYREKPHIHLYMHAASRLDTSILDDTFKECSVNPPLKTLFGLDCVCNSFTEWYWYALHNSRYCHLKNLKKEFTYTKDDFKYSDKDMFDYYVSTALHDQKLLSELSVFENYINGSVMDSYECITTGTVPLKNVMQLNYFDNIRRRHFDAIERAKEHTEISDAFRRLSEFESKQIDIDFN